MGQELELSYQLYQLILGKSIKIKLDSTLELFLVHFLQVGYFKAYYPQISLTRIMNSLFNLFLPKFIHLTSQLVSLLSSTYSLLFFYWYSLLVLLQFQIKLLKESNSLAQLIFKKIKNMEKVFSTIVSRYRPDQYKILHKQSKMRPTFKRKQNKT